MADKFMTRLSVGLLAALSLGVAVLPSAKAEDTAFSGAAMGRGSWMNNYNRGYTVGIGGYGAPWWGGGGYGGSNMVDVSNQLLYPTADGPQPTTTPVPSYATEAADAQMTSHPVPHQEGPSMSFRDDFPDMTKASSYFKGFYQDMRAGAMYGGPGGGPAQQQCPPQSMPRLAHHVSTDYDTPPGSHFDHPVVQSRLSGSGIAASNSNRIEVMSELRPQLQDAEQLFSDLKAQDKLGTFDLEPLEAQMVDLRRRAREVSRIQNTYEQKAEMGKLINDINDFEYQLKLHQ